MSLSADPRRGIGRGCPARRSGGHRGRRPSGKGRDRHRGHQGRRARPCRPDVHLHDRPRPARPARDPSPRGLRPGDRVIVSGPVGEHGTAIMLARGELGLDAEIESDTCSLWPAVDALLDAAGPALRCMRDATRGGVASVLNELARASGVAMIVNEAAVPVDPAVAGASELLGIDPLYVANEGKFVAFVAPEAADEALAALRVGARLRARRRDRRGQDRAAGHGAGRDRVRRAARDGPAGRRPATEDLLRRARARDSPVGGGDRRPACGGRRVASVAAEGRAPAPGRPVRADVRVRAGRRGNPRSRAPSWRSRSFRPRAPAGRAARTRSSRTFPCAVRSAGAVTST